MEMFDSLVHPSDSAKWFGNASVVQSFEELRRQSSSFNSYGACAVALPNMGFESPIEYYKKCMMYDFYPVYYYDFNSDISQLDLLYQIGYRAVKIHTRLSNVNLDVSIDFLRKVFAYCEHIGLKVFFCTYFHSTLENYPAIDTRSLIVRLFRGFKNLKVVLLHGGDVSILEVAQLIRFNENFLLDTSYTLMKFRGSTIESNITHLMSTLDRRISVGSDWPDFSLADFKTACENYTRGLEETSVERVLGGNLKKFLDL